MGRRSNADSPAMDARGLVRFPEELAVQLDANGLQYASVFIDAQGQRVAVAFSRQAQPGSFKLIAPGGRPALFLRGAFLAAGIELRSGQLEATSEGGLLILGRGTVGEKGSWLPFHCRSSADIPMVTLDARGTLTLDRLCLRALAQHDISSAEPHFEEAGGVITLTFSQDGALAVRRVASHAELSFRGTLSAYGLALPTRRIRYAATLMVGALRFSLKDPFLPTRA